MSRLEWTSDEIKKLTYFNRPYAMSVLDDLFKGNRKVYKISSALGSKRDVKISLKPKHYFDDDYHSYGKPTIERFELFFDMLIEANGIIRVASGVREGEDGHGVIFLSLPYTISFEGNVLHETTLITRESEL